MNTLLTIIIAIALGALASIPTSLLLVALLRRRVGRGEVSSPRLSPPRLIEEPDHE